ncbi:MAG: DNA/RNA non-specific endonuclease [Bacteroidales bacterium]
MKQIKLLFLSLILLSFSSCYCQGEFLGVSATKKMHAKLNRMKPKGLKGQLVFHTDYILSYNEGAEQANWVLYELTDKEVKKPMSRTDDFRYDPFIKTVSAEKEDYASSGYDRGHLAPAADMHASKKVMSESFYMSNMSPQLPQFNRGIWKKLEERVRVWAEKNNTIYVVTGPVLTDGPYDSIGKNRVVVPKRYYKVVLVDNPGNDNDKMISFLLENKGSKQALQKFVVSTDQLEKITGLDFFPFIEDKQEALLEASSDTNKWDFVSRPTKVKKDQQFMQNKEQAKKAQTPKTKVKKVIDRGVQCKGLTKAGKRCKKHTKNPNGYCSLHQSQAKK